MPLSPPGMTSRMQPITDKAALSAHEAQISCQRAANWLQKSIGHSVHCSLSLSVTVTVAVRTGTWLLSGWLCTATFVACGLPGLMAWNRLRVGTHRAALHSTKQRALQFGNELKSRMSDLNAFIALFRDTIDVRPPNHNHRA